MSDRPLFTAREFALIRRRQRLGDGLAEIAQLTHRSESEIDLALWHGLGLPDEAAAARANQMRRAAA